MRLIPISPSNYPQAQKLGVKPEQEHLVAPIQKSLADAYVYQDAWFRLLSVEETILGYVLLFPFDSENGRTVNIVRLMIDQNHQGQGHGKAAINQVIQEVVTWTPPVDQIRISTLPENEIAISLYRNIGFKEKGLEDGEVTFYQKLTPIHEHQAD